MVTDPTAGNYNTPPGANANVDQPTDPVLRNTAKGTSLLDDKDYVRRVRKWYSEVKQHTTELRDHEEEDLRYYSGHQWSDEQKAILQGEKAPALTINNILPMVNAVVGEERMNRQEIKVYGRDDSVQDDMGAFAMSELIRWVMDECNGLYALSNAFRYCVISGRGYIEIKMDYLDDPQGKIDVDNVHPLEMYIDPLSRKPDMSDARYLIREKWLPEDEIEAMWPDQVDELRARYDSEDFAGIFKETDPRKDAYINGDKIYRTKDGTWQVLEVWHYEIVPGGIAVNPDTGQIEELVKEDLDLLVQDNQQKIQQGEQQAQQAAMMGDPVVANQAMMNIPQPLQYVERPVKCYYQGFVVGEQVLERRKSPLHTLKRFPYIPVHGMWDDHLEGWFGIVRCIKDIQKQLNVSQSSVQRWIQRSPKVGWIGPKGSFFDLQNWRQNSSKPGFVGEYNQRGTGKPEEIQAATIPRHIIELPNQYAEMMRFITGVNMDLMGVSQRQDAGIVLQLRQHQGMTVLQTLYDNLRLSRKLLGKALISFIQQFIADDRKVRVLGADGPQYVMASSDLQFGQFDAVVEDSNESPTAQLSALFVLQTLLPALAKAGFPPPPEIVDLLPIPPKIKSQWKAHIQQMMGMPPMMEPGAPGTPMPAPPPGAAPAGPPPSPTG